MNDAISNYGRMTQSNAAARSAIDKVEKQGPSAAQAKEELAPSLEKTASAGADKLSLSNVAQKVMAQPDFDRSKVEAIKQAINSLLSMFGYLKKYLLKKLKCLKNSKPQNTSLPSTPKKKKASSTE
jgi:anti-sigma28 factor (negative regulator of flagellin synthesis)